jgi:hypothetical protein
MYRRLFLAGVVLMLGGASTPSALADTKSPAVTRAEIFLFRWENTTRSRLSLEAVRQGYESMTVLRDDVEIAGLLDVLNPSAFHAPVPDAGRDRDYRLVVDLVHADGTKETFAADYGWLVRLADGAYRPIDASFRRRFSFSKGVTP